MRFEDWLIHHGLSVTSALKYGSAISGAMSQWAVDAGIIHESLTSIKSHSYFEAVALKIRALPIYQERNERGHNMYNCALNKYGEYLAERFDSDVESDIDNILKQEKVTDTEKSALLKTRIGQGIFRQKLIAYWNKCAVTGYKDTSLLVASHIKPWKVSTNSERIDHFNGLLLLPNLDKAFDGGLISFADDGKIIISRLLREPEVLGFSAAMRLDLEDSHKQYMRFHREKVYRTT